MTDDDHKLYNRKRATGVFPWEIEGVAAAEEKEHPAFSRRSQQAEVIKEGARVQPLPDDFEPGAEIVEYLHIFQGIPADFIAEQLVDFKLYWKETGEARKAWQNKFKTHVIYRWKRENSERRENPHKSTVEKLTDTSWEDDDWADQFEGD